MPSKLVKRGSIVVSVLLVVIAAAAAGGYVASEKVITAKVTVPVEQVAVPTDSLSIERGRHLATAISKCVDCHGQDFGGQLVMDAPPIGHIGGPNLTRGKGGIGAQLKDEDYVRAVRHAVARDGHKIPMMPSSEYNAMSTEDLGALIAFLKQVPPVDRASPPVEYGPVGRGLIAAGKLPMFTAEVIDHAKPAPATSPMPGPNATYGRYLANIGGCTGCHGPTLAGGRILQGPPDWPPAANLTPTGMKSYDEASFMKTLRTGVRPSGVALNPAMPWKMAGQMTDDEIRAVWEYLKSIPPREFGAR